MTVLVLLTSLMIATHQIHQLVAYSSLHCVQRLNKDAKVCVIDLSLLPCIVSQLYLSSGFNNIMLVNPSSLLQVFHRLKVFVSCPNSHGSSVSMNCRWHGLDTKIEVYILFVYIQLLTSG